MVLNKRQTYILQSILCHPGCTGEELAQASGISTRTLTADIELINGLLKPYGLLLETRRGAGYICSPPDSSQLDYIKSQLIRRDYYSFHDENDFTDRVGQIIRTLITAEDYVKMDDIAETLWLTRSSINQELKEVRRLLKRYGLELLTKPHYGLLITGRESALRQCMTDFCKPYFHTLDAISFLEDGYSRYGLSHKQVTQAYEVILSSLQTHSLRCSDQSLQRLTIALLVMEQRLKKGRTVSLSAELSAAVRQSAAYDSARIILQKTLVPVLGTIPEEIAETTFFTLLILAGADFYHTPGYLLEDCGVLYHQAIELHDQLLDFFRDRLYMIFSGDAQFSHALLKLLLQYNIRRELGIAEFEYAGPAYELASRLPVSRQLACESLLYLESLTGYGADQYLMVNFTLLFYNTVMSIPSNRKKLRMLCVGPHNLYYSRSIGYKIKAQHHNYVDNIDYCTAYELQHIDLRKYDYILTSEPPEVLPPQKVLPVLEMKYFLGWKDLYDFRNRVVLPQISMETLFKDAANLAVDKMPECQNIEEFITWGAREQPPDRVRAIIRYNELLPILPADGKVALCCYFLPPGHSWDTRMIKFKTPLRHGQQSITYGIVCGIPLNFDTNVLKVADSLLRRVLLDENRILAVPDE